MKSVVTKIDDSCAMIAVVAVEVEMTAGAVMTDEVFLILVETKSSRLFRWRSI